MDAFSVQFQQLLCLCLLCRAQWSDCLQTIFVPDGQSIRVPLTFIHPEGYLPFEVKAESGTTVILQGRQTTLSDICLKYIITSGNTHVIQYDYIDTYNIGETVDYDTGAVLDWGSVKSFWASWEAHVMMMGLGDRYGKHTLGSLPPDWGRTVCNPQSFWVYSSGNTLHPSEVTFPNETLPIPPEPTILTDGDSGTCTHIGEHTGRLWGLKNVLDLDGINPIVVTSYGEADMPCGRHGIQLAVNADQRDDPWLRDDIYLELCTLVHQEVVNGTSVCRFTCSCVTTDTNTCRFLYILNKSRGNNFSVCEVFIE